LAQSRKRRKERQRAAASIRRPEPPAEPAASAAPEPSADTAPAPSADAAPQPSPRGYARGRAKDEAARAALKPLAPGERPGAVTVGAIVALVLAAANLIAVVAGWNGAVDDDDRARAVAGSLLVTGLLAVVAWGMWKARYWAVLGMQTLLALTIIAATLGLVTAANVVAMLVLVLTIALAGTLFWFLVKAMARIQMPERPSRAR
jgi:hypothetical protein